MEIPLRTLYNAKYDNLLAAGRIISAEGKAWDMTRVIPPCVLTGEACGIIASIIVDKKINIKEIDIKEVQNKMVERGNILHHK